MKPNSSNPPPVPRHSQFAKHALLVDGWANNVRLHWDESGNLTHIECDASPQSDEPVEQIILPGMINLHSHAFQRAMAGMTEIAGDGPDSFWTWRDLMYRFALAISPDQMQAIAAQLYSECLRHGYTSVCEFHYLHRAPDGALYGNMAETSERLAAAANETGIGITLLPVLYSYADFGAIPLRHEQRRFSTNPEQLLKIVSQLEKFRSGQVEVGVAPHSLRAATTGQISELTAALEPHRPIHIHIAEQTKEVESCLAFANKRPVELLYETQDVSKRWCLVHATHLTDAETSLIAKSQAIAGICTSTEGNLGDGFFPLPDFIAQQGQWGIGSDSHVSQSPIEELRWLEYGQRLRAQRRNMAHVKEQRRIGDYLWHASIQGGAQASGRKVGQLAAGYRADFLVLDANHPVLEGVATKDLLNSWIFAGNDNLVRHVMVGGRWCVRDAEHVAQDAIQQRFKSTMTQLRSL